MNGAYGQEGGSDTVLAESRGPFECVGSSGTHDPQTGWHYLQRPPICHRGHASLNSFFACEAGTSVERLYLVTFKEDETLAGWDGVYRMLFAQQKALRPSIAFHNPGNVFAS
jgi:hypothetical protein